MKKLLIGVLIGLSITTVGCKTTTQQQQNLPEPPVTTSPGGEYNPPKIEGEGNSTPERKQRTFTIDELSTFNGLNGNPAYVAVDGLVYDVTFAPGWKNGVHELGYVAGSDMSNVIESYPNGREALKDLPIVGTLKY